MKSQDLSLRSNARPAVRGEGKRPLAATAALALAAVFAIPGIASATHRSLIRRLFLFVAGAIAASLSLVTSAQETSCRTSQDCGTGEVCVVITVSNDGQESILSSYSEKGHCEPAGCQSDSECGADEMCTTHGAGIPNSCAVRPTPEDTPNVGGGAGLVEAPPVMLPPRAETPPQPPPPETQTPPAAPGKAGKKDPIKVHVVVRGKVDQNILEAAMGRIRKELDKAFGTDGYKVERKSASEPPAKGPRDFTLYLVDGNKPPTDIWPAHGLTVSAEKSGSLKSAFDPNSAVRGTNNGHVAIIPTDKVFPTDAEKLLSPENHLVSNVMLHELGHQLLGCNDNPKDPDPACGEVMQRSPSPRYDQGYTPAAVEEMRNRFPLVIHEIPRYTAAWQPSTVGELQLYGWTTDALRAKYDELWAEGWRLKLLSPYVVSDEVRYVAVFQPSTEGEIQVYGWSYPDYRAQYDALWGQGWRLKLLSTYVINNEVRYTAVWQPSTEGEIQLYGWSTDALRTKYDELWLQGWRLKLLSPYVQDGEVRYVAVFKPSTDSEIQVYDWSLEDFRMKYNELWNQGWRLKLLSPYAINNDVRYTAVWQPGTEDEQVVDGWSYEDFRAQYDKLWSSGWRLKSLNLY